MMPWKQHWKQLLLLASVVSDGNSQLDVKSNYPLPATANSTIIGPVMQAWQQKMVHVTTNPAEQLPVSGDYDGCCQLAAPSHPKIKNNQPVVTATVPAQAR